MFKSVHFVLIHIKDINEYNVQNKKKSADYSLVTCYMNMHTKTPHDDNETL